MISNLEKILRIIYPHLCKTKKSSDCNEIKTINLDEISKNPLLNQFTKKQIKEELKILPQIQTKNKELKINPNLKIYNLNGLKDCLAKKQLDLIYFSQMDSTNDYLLAKSTQLHNPSLCLTEYQTKARGRYQNKWLCSPFSQITFSYFFKTKKFTQLEFLAIAIGIETALSLEKLGFAELRLKWPNDLYYRQHNQYKKLAGILIDTQQKKDEHPIIIGLGLNLNKSDENSSQNFASLELINSQLLKNLTKNEILLALIEAIEKAIKNLTTLTKLDSSYQRYLKLWQKYDFLIDKTITVKTTKQNFTGLNQGINKIGQILLKQKDKQTAFSSAEISIDKDSFNQPVD